MPRILILHASVGSGHLRAAEALAEAFARKPDTEVRVEDALDYSNQLFRQAYTRSYLELSERAPFLWQLFYQGTNTSDPEAIELTNRLRTMVERLGIGNLERLVRGFSPAAIICTHFLPIELLLRLKDRGQLPHPIYCVVTDFFAHTFWITPGIDGYFVAADMTRDTMVVRGVPASIVHVSGIPVDLKITEEKPLQLVRAQYGFALGESLIVLFGGGLDPMRVRSMIEGLLSCGRSGNLVVVSGRNQSLVDALSDLTDGPLMRLHKLGMISYVDDLVAASDLVISKAGGLIVSEVLARGAPLLLIDPIPGHEEWNADYVVSMGAGIQLRMAESVPLAVTQLFDQPERLSSLRACAQTIGRPHAAMKIAEHVLRSLQSGVVIR